MWLLARHLAPDNDVNVIALNRGGYFADRLREQGISVEVLKKRFRFDPLTWWRLRSILWKYRPQIVQSFLFASNSLVRFRGVCPSGTKIIVSERCVDSWKSGWQLKIDRRLVDRMDKMTANSESVANFYHQQVGVPKERIKVIPNGVSIPTGEPVTNLRSELNLPPDAKVVGFVGRLAPQKCLPDLLWAFQLLTNVMDNTYLVLIGEGPQRDELAEVAASLGCRSRLVFMGHRDDAGELMTQFDVFCLPSSFEGMSNSLMEAMASGVPVVVSNIEPNLELVEHEESGLVFQQGQGPEIARAIVKVLEDNQLANRLANNASQKITQKHSVEQMVNRHLELYRNLCGDQSSATSGSTLN